MWHSKKFLLATVLAIVVLLGSIGGVALAQTGTGDDSQPAAQHEALLNRVCAIYEENTGVAINSEELENAFTQARDEMQAAAMEDRLAKMVENGVIDEAQAQELQEWLESKPDVAIPFTPGFSGHGMPRGFGGFPGGDAPEPTE